MRICSCQARQEDKTEGKQLFSLALEEFTDLICNRGFRSATVKGARSASWFINSGAFVSHYKEDNYSICMYTKKGEKLRRRQTCLSIKDEIVSLLCNLLLSSANLALIHFGSKPEGVQCLREVLFTWRDVDKHQCLGVAAQRALKQVGQLGVAVRNVRVLQAKTNKRWKCIKQLPLMSRL